MNVLADVDIRRMVNEELTRPEIRSMINSCIDDFLKEKEFENRVKEIVSDVFETYFRMMYTKRGFWKNSLKK